MGSRRRSRKRLSARPQGPSFVQNQPVEDLPLIPEEQHRHISPPPPTSAPLLPATPRHPGVTEDNLTPKHPEFLKKVDTAMTSRYHSTTVATLLSLVPGPNVPARHLKNLGNFRDYKVKKDELKMYPVLCRELNVVAGLSGSGHIFKDIANWYQDPDVDHRPDLALYPTHPLAVAAYELGDSAVEKSQASPARKPFIARCAYQWMITAVEVKKEGGETGFGFKPKEPLLRTAEKSYTVRSQFATYAAEIMLRQHRTHLFMIFIAGWHARIFRWDRNGAIVSNPINLKTDAKLLFDFVYRLVRANKTVQGFDPTVSLATDAEINLLQNYTSQNKYLKGYKALMLENMKEYPLHKVECDEVLQFDGRRRTRASRKKSYLIGKHVAGGYAPVGRGTKGWVCYCIEDDTLAFLKEQWRANAVGVHPEIETYKRLREHNVHFVATVVAGGDVSSHRGVHKTISQRYFDKEGINLPERIQTRLVLKDVGRPLESYADSSELLLILGTAIKGHQEAWEQAGVLHRDISIGNILIDVKSTTERPLGFLNDWDLCKYKEELYTQAAPSQPGVSGTWAFGSALSLRFPRKPKELADDLESFIYVPLYCAFRYQLHDLSSGNYELMKKATQIERQKDNLENDELAETKHNFFYSEKRHSNGLYTGGRSKFKAIRSAEPPIDLAEPCSPLGNLLRRAFTLLRKHYKTVDMSYMKENYSATPPRHQRVGRRPKVPTPAADIAPDYLLEIFNLQAPRVNTGAFPSSPSSAPSSSSPGPSAPRPLDDHKAIMQLFAHAYYTDQGERIAAEPFRNDKLYDQFDGTCVIVPKPYNNSSRTSSKRKAGDADPNPRPKKTPSHGWQANFDGPSQQPQPEPEDEDEDGSSSESESDSDLDSISDSDSNDGAAPQS